MCPTAMGHWATGTPAIHYVTVFWHWAMELLPHNASLSWGSGQWCSLCKLPRCVEGVGKDTASIHCPIDLRQWEVELLPYNAALAWDNGQWNYIALCPTLTTPLLCSRELEILLHASSLLRSTTPLGGDFVTSCNIWSGTSIFVCSVGDIYVCKIRLGAGRFWSQMHQWGDAARAPCLRDEKLEEKKRCFRRFLDR